MAGTTLNDRKLAADVRTLTLKEIKRALEGEDEDFKKQVILRLAPTALPRLTEVTGEDGGAILIMPAELITKNDTSPNPESSRTG